MEIRVDNGLMIYYNEVKSNTENLGSREVPPAHRAQRAADAVKAAPGGGANGLGRAERTGEQSPQ